MELYHEKPKSSLSLFGAVLIVIIIVGALVYLIPKKEEAAPVDQNNSAATDVSTQQNPDTLSVSSEEDIEADLNSFDSNTDDINFDGSQF